MFVYVYKYQQVIKHTLTTCNVYEKHKQSV